MAAELNLSETAFLVPRPDGDHDLRWFTPTTEVDLCGHAILASAHVLGGERRFHTRSGVLRAAPATGGAVSLDFPANLGHRHDHAVERATCLDVRTVARLLAVERHQSAGLGARARGPAGQHNLMPR